MKTRYISALLLALTMVGTSCSDFLDREPLDAGTSAIYYKNVEQFKQAANGLYNLEGWKNYNGGTIYDKLDRGSDLDALTSDGGGSAPEGDYRWDRPYSYIYGCNVLLEKADEYTGSDKESAEFKQSVGTAYFFRAWQHFYLLQTFGGVPIADHVFDVKDPVLYGPRNSRYEVAKFIIDDLEKAIPLLPKAGDGLVSGDNGGKITQEAAKAFLARVCLYEGTWEKYVPTIGYDLDGDGTNVGAGSTKPDGYPSVTDLLTKAKNNADDVMKVSGPGKQFELWNECDTLSYYYLFNIDDQDGNLSNFNGVGKTTNKEFIISVKYDYNVKRAGINIAHTYCGQVEPVPINANFGRSFLCRNGLPIRISYTGEMKDAQDNPQFGGYDTFVGEYRNRDYRFISTTFVPDRKTWMSDRDYGNPNTTAGQPYDTPVFPKDEYDPSDPAFSSKAAIFRPTLLDGGTFNGYGCRKYMPEGAGRAENTHSADMPLLRLAEVYLIYAEATCELGGGNISDADLDKSINLLRDRAGVAHLTNALIENVWDAGWWDNKQNKTVCHKMNMLDEIRRERACELFGERLRMDDIKRWGIAKENMTGQKLGRKVYGTAYTTSIANDATYHGQPCYQEDKHPLTYGVMGDANHPCDVNDPDYGRSIANIAGNMLFGNREYLAPLPLNQLRLNNALKQNPDW